MSLPGVLTYRYPRIAGQMGFSRLLKSTQKRLAEQLDIHGKHEEGEERGAQRKREPPPPYRCHRRRLPPLQPTAPAFPRLLHYYPNTCLPHLLQLHVIIRGGRGR